VCDDGRGVSSTGRAVYLDLTEAASRLGKDALVERYGNLLELYQQLTDDDPLSTPMRIYPAAHYTMGGLWVDYQLMSTLPGLFVTGEANFSDHGANRLGASALMQALADGYFIAPRTVGHYLAAHALAPISENSAAASSAQRDVEARLNRLVCAGGTRTASDFHRELGEILWQHCGLERERAGLEHAREQLLDLSDRFWRELRVPGSSESFNAELEHAGRVADFIELGALMCRDALAREESCGSHFRADHPQRDDARCAHVAVWQHDGDGEPRPLTEPLSFETTTPTARSYA
jgi:succinate dehydrogenase / fumarate reductase flavoprotein subunit